MTIYPLTALSRFLYKLLLFFPAIALLIVIPIGFTAIPAASDPPPILIVAVVWLIATIISVIWYRSIIHTILLAGDGQLILRSVRGEAKLNVQEITVIKRSFPNRHLIMQTTSDDYFLSYNTNLIELSYEGIANLISEIKRLNPNVEVIGILD